MARARLDEFGAGRIAELQRLQETLGRVPTDERYAGKDGCTECHAELLAHWSRTPHAEAWRALVERGEENNPDCLPCHTTGFGQPGGFADPRDRGLRNVQCEACHGPMLLHLEQAGRVGFRPDPGLRVNEASCLVCHDEANSPRFDFGTYSTGVAHPD